MMLKTKRTVKSPILFRSFTVDRAKVVDSEQGRTVELAFSSETPCRAYNWDVGVYNEILDHKSESVDLKRLNGGAPLLLEHDRHDQIGVIENARIDADKVGRATVRFGKGAKASEIFQDVKDGIRSLVSVGYRVHELVTEKVESDGPSTMRATRWEPMEVSIVSIPADTSVGVGRSEKTDDTNEVTIFEEKEEQVRINLDKDAPAGGGGVTVVTEPTKAPAVSDADKKRMKEERKTMYELAKRHDCMDLYESAIDKDQDLNEFRGLVLEKISGKDNAGTEYRVTDRRSAILTPGEAFANSERYKAAVKTGQRTGFKIELDSDFQSRATFLTTTGLTGYERPPGVVLLEQQPLTIAQLFAQGQTGLPTVRFVRETSYTNAAAAVAEEGQKPEATFDLEEVDAGVKKIAVVGRVTDEMFDDFPFVRDYVNNRLRFMVESKEDSELLNGDGTSNRITGILSTSNIQTQTAGTEPTVADAIHKAITKVQSVGFFMADTIVMHPTDYQTVRLTKDANGQYFGGGPFGGAYGNGQYSNVGVMWGLPVVRTTAIAQGTALVGAFRLGAQLFRRSGLTLESTNSDASDFQYNRIALRAETRLTLAVYRPLAFCTVTGITA